MYEWWKEEEPLPEGKKWRHLEHNGVIFPPKYEPHGVKMLYDGEPVELNAEQVKEGLWVIALVDPLITFEYKVHGNPWILCMYQARHEWKHSKGSGGVRVLGYDAVASPFGSPPWRRCSVLGSWNSWIRHVATACSKLSIPWPEFQTLNLCRAGGGRYDVRRDGEQRLPHQEDVCDEFLEGFQAASGEEPHDPGKIWPLDWRRRVFCVGS